MSGFDQGYVGYSDSNLVDLVKPPDQDHQVEKAVFVDFICNFRRGKQAYYREQLRRNCSLHHYVLQVSLTDLLRFNEDYYNLLLNEPSLYIDLLQEAAKLAYQSTLVQPLPLDQIPNIQATLTSDGDITPRSLRQLTSSDVSKLVCITGIVIASSRIQSKATSLCIECRQCHDQQILSVPPGFNAVELPRSCRASEMRHADEVKCGANPYVIQPEKTQYIDQQILKLQEAPEWIPTGELPRHAQLMIERILVGRAIPGTRVVLIGILALNHHSSVHQRGDRGALRNALVHQPYIRILGLDINSDGLGRATATFTEEQVTEFKNFAKRPDVYQAIVSQMAPIIYGHYDIKCALACQLFGGCRKVLPDGMKLRGDINILLLGDPGTAKSQLLKFIERIAPIGVFTSGKGSSAAGLTASIIRDPITAQFYLEGGAMVLADGGIVCIDEFDKMRQQDRVAIHEAMEQQTISIAKAGITTILNSRTAVLAAANPSFGVYDESHTAAENLNEFRSTILSRFDAIFLIQDIRDEIRDLQLSKHVLNAHMNYIGPTRAHINPFQHNSNFNNYPEKTYKPSHDEMDINKLKSYIAYCRQNCTPRLAESASDELVHQYVMMRRQYKEREKSGEDNAVPITVRQLEAIIRFSEALAKMSLSLTTTNEHVTEAIRIFTVSSIQATNSGRVVMERLSNPMRIEIENIQLLIKKRLPIETTISVKQLISQFVKTFNLSEINVKRAIVVMVQKEEMEYRAQRKLLYRRK